MNKIQLDISGIEAVIFDMNGTMIDDMGFHKKAWREYFKSIGVELTDEDFKWKISGANNAKIFENILGHKLTPEEVKKYGNEKEAFYRKIYAPYIKEVPGLKDLINIFKSKNLKVAIATTAIEPNRKFVLDALGLENEFDVILGDEQVTNGKPNPEIYLETAKKLEVDVSKCSVFEDTTPGVEAGKNAGMKVVGVLTTHTKEDLKDADYLIKDFTEIQIN
jgi:beta-phosphoglucomutase family hydrolase